MRNRESSSCKQECRSTTHAPPSGMNSDMPHITTTCRHPMPGFTTSKNAKLTSTRHDFSSPKSPTEKQNECTVHTSPASHTN